MYWTYKITKSPFPFRSKLIKLAGQKPIILQLCDLLNSRLLDKNHVNQHIVC
jgi:hypothetical protein